MTENLQPRPAWRGSIAIAPGIGVFCGQAGDNRAHHHWAHQLSLGLDGPVRLLIDGEVCEADALFIRAGAAHQLLPGRVLSCYVDPTSAAARAIEARLGSKDAVLPLPAVLAAAIRQAFFAQESLAAGLQNLQEALQLQSPPAMDDALNTVLQALDATLSGRTEAQRRQDLARLVGLSESRFSHWFRERTGMPLRSYYKWLRLVRGVEQVLSGRRLTDAAYDAEFSDQAHFTRTFVALFGVKPSDLLGHLSPE